MSDQSAMDIFFLSFNEANRERNWQMLKSQFPKSRRIHGVKGLALAHQMCAQISSSPFFFIVNGDNEILTDRFQFQPPERPLKAAVYVWRSLNPVNQLAYGFGGVKLFPRSAFLSPSNFVDLSSSLKAPYKIVPQIASLTCFNASPLDAWRGAFRECAKLSSQCIPHQKPLETEERLKIWCERGKEKPFGPYAILGARQGRDYGRQHKQNQRALNKINDFFWLENFFWSNAHNKNSN